LAHASRENQTCRLIHSNFAEPDLIEDELNDDDLVESKDYTEIEVRTIATKS